MIPSGVWTQEQNWNSKKPPLPIYPIPRAQYWRQHWVPAMNIDVPDNLVLLANALGRSNSFMRSFEKDGTYTFVGVGHEDNGKQLVVRSQYEFDMLAKRW